MLGAVCAKAMAPEDGALPGHIVITPGGGGGRGNDSAYLGPKYASIHLGNGKPPQYTTRPGQLSESMDAARHEFRRRVNDRFLSRRRTAVTEAYTYSYEQAHPAHEEAGRLRRQPRSRPRTHERYGKYDLGRHCLLARRLLEKGATFVQVSHSNYDTHNENFNFHIEQLGEFDRSFAAFVADLADRGMLESTLIVVLSEFGRTPNINYLYGRDHWSHAWTVVMAGARVHRGVAYGKTNDKGTEVVDGQVDHGNLFHTYLQAVGRRLDRLVRRRGPRRPDRRPGVEDDQADLVLTCFSPFRFQKERHGDTRRPRSQASPRAGPVAGGTADGLLPVRAPGAVRVLRARELDDPARLAGRREEDRLSRAGTSRGSSRLAFSPDGETTYSGGGDGRVVSLGDRGRRAEADPDDRGAPRVGPCHGRQPRRQALASGGNDRAVRLWEAASGRLVHELTGHLDHVYSL